MRSGRQPRGTLDQPETTEPRVNGSRGVGFAVRRSPALERAESLDGDEGASAPAIFFGIGDTTRSSLDRESLAPFHWTPRPRLGGVPFLRWTIATFVVDAGHLRFHSWLGVPGSEGLFFGSRAVMSAIGSPLRWPVLLRSRRAGPTEKDSGRFGQCPVPARRRGDRFWRGTLRSSGCSLGPRLRSQWSCRGPEWPPWCE